MLSRMLLVFALSIAASETVSADVKIIVIDDQKKPYSGAEVRIEKDKENGLEDIDKGNTDKNGVFTSKKLPVKGSVIITAFPRAGDMRYKPTPVKLDDPKRSEITIELALKAKKP